MEEAKFATPERRARRASTAPTTTFHRKGSSGGSSSTDRVLRSQSRASSDVFPSPVEWSKQPSYERDAKDVSRLFTDGSDICREHISSEYIEEALNDPNVALWLVRDASRVIFGFAFTRDHTTHIELKLICMKRRKGEGMKLFEDILKYSQTVRRAIHLQAIDKKLAFMYAEAARKMNHGVFLGDSQQVLRKTAFKTAVSNLGAGLIPMRIVPPNVEPDISKHIFGVQKLKKAKRRMYDSDESDDE